MFELREGCGEIVISGTDQTRIDGSGDNCIKCACMDVGCGGGI